MANSSSSYVAADSNNAYSLALKNLRDALRNPTSLTPDDLSFHLSSTLQTLHLHATSTLISTASTTTPDDLLKSIARYLLSIQGLILSDIVPTFYDALDRQAQASLRTLFVPPKSRVEALVASRQVALSTYLTLPAFLNAPKPATPTLPRQSRSFVIEVLDTLVDSYGIDDVYHSVFGGTKGKRGKEGAEELQWEDAVRAVVAIPAKVGNAIGRWNSESGGAGREDVPDRLLSKPYFGTLSVRLEGLMYELSQNEYHGTGRDLETIRLVLEKLSSIGLITSQPPAIDSRAPSILSALLPPLLAHLHPPRDSPLPPYPADFFPSILLGLPSSTLNTVVSSLIPHLSYHLIENVKALEPDIPDERIRRAQVVLSNIVGPPKIGGEAWNAVLRYASSGKCELSLNDTRRQAANRMIVLWVTSGDEAGLKALIESILAIWTDPKYVKFTFYAQQFNLTHLLILSLSQLPRFSPWLIALSHRSKTIMAFQSYLSHPDSSIRRLGMLVAEILSELTIPEPPNGGPGKAPNEEIEELRKGLEVDEDGSDGLDQTKAPSSGGGLKRLKFSGMWDGDGQGKEEARWLRKAVGISDKEATLSDDPTGQSWLLGWRTEPIAIRQDSAPSPILAPTDDPARGRTANAREPKPTSSKSKTNSAHATKPKIVMLDPDPDPDQLEDPMEGYASSSPSSSRSPSPTPSYLEEVAADPTLALDATQKKKVARPVYIPQLVELLKEREKPECIEMGLKFGESLVRAKREFGTELAENAVAVALMTLGLNDPFHLEGFEEKRQGVMNALVACAPKQVAPFLCEQYFNAQFSLQQKSVILTALAMGARELAGLSVPQAQNTRRIDFPSKVLPIALHRKYISEADVPSSRRAVNDTDRRSTTGQLEEATNGIRNLLLSKGAKKGDDVPEIARERRLRVGVGSGKNTMVAELGTLSAHQMEMAQDSSKASSVRPVMAFKDIAAEYFIMPLINRFWLHFQDSSIRESRAISTGTRYRGAGAGMVLSPMALEKYLMTLAVLLHAARHSSVFLAVLCPEALELALTIGSRQPSSTRSLATIGGADADADADAEITAEGQVIGSALELSLVVLDGSFELDAGRTLAMEKPALLLGVGEWATAIFQAETEGSGEIRGGLGIAAGQGGRGEGRIRANAAGVVLKVGEIGEKWGHLGLRF
ncbi:hypothetical protein I316_00312 [Kwoniella heveanensis BCC8398]|uniref:Telomere length regulation protein conserved domain-containing protein n=1 Tax=Kwoniella heveanensis BCC8398 TaxID=1296120 RepID=A0A1B9H4A3_9TREE|nr:hypothetical protein I316_00312 [Kwoniella heveanensis BCC8398]